MTHISTSDNPPKEGFEAPRLRVRPETSFEAFRRQNRNLISGVVIAGCVVALHAGDSTLRSLREDSADSVRNNELATVLALSREGFSNLDVTHDKTGGIHFVVEGLPYSSTDAGQVNKTFRSETDPSQCFSIDGFAATPVQHFSCANVADTTNGK